MAVAQTQALPQPLPLVPHGSVRISDAVWLCEHTSGAGSVFVWGQATWSWSCDDAPTRKLAAVQLVSTKAAFQRQVAAGFGVDEDTLILWRKRYEDSGVEGLVTRRPGPKGPSKLTDAKRSEIAALRREGLSQQAIAERAGVSKNMVFRALKSAAAPAPVVEDDTTRPSLTPLARPTPRTAERQAARAGMLSGAEPVITEGASLPMAGALVVLPALAATGLVDAASSIYATGRGAFYSLRSLFLCVVFVALLGEPRAEGLTRLDPQSLGRLVGLDRAPEVKTLRRRMEELATMELSDRLLSTLARHHLGAGGEEASGIFYVDGHVRAYHGSREVQKAHVARIRLAMPAVLDTWVCDRFGTGLLVWEAKDPSLVGELKKAAAQIRSLVGEEARPTICFDRGGWSPKLFAKLSDAGFDVLTYRKEPLRLEPKSAFGLRVFTDALGRHHDYWLAERRVAISYRDKHKKRRVIMRQITRLDPLSGHQTQVLTTRMGADAPLVAHLMFGRWCEENFFRYMRAHFALDALDSYATADEDPERLVTNPKRRAADKELQAARRSLAAAQSAQGKAAFSGRPADHELRQAFQGAQAEVDGLAAAARALPAKVALSEARPEMVRLASERKRIMDAIRMAAYNAESALARLLAPHYARADDEARSLLHEMFATSGDMEVRGDELHVTLDSLSAPRRTRAMAALCEELTATKTLYPGTELTLVYAVKTGE